MKRSSEKNVPLSEHTTLGVGGPAERLVTAGSAGDLIGLVAAADTDGTDFLLLAGGSNVLISDDGFSGLVIKPTYRDGTEAQLPDGSMLLDYGAGCNWDELVAETVEAGLSGIEALSGIPGSLGAAPMQNIGAYGQELAETVRSVNVYDRQLRRTHQLAASDCGFGYRTSIFKGNDRYVILSVQLRLTPSELSRPVRYEELAGKLGIEVGARAPLEDVRKAVLELRRGKGMVLDPADPDTRSAGSFFLNPVVATGIADSLPAEAPRWPAPGGAVKLSAAWLIEQAGFSKGYSGAHKEVALSGKHTLAITNRGGAKAAQIAALAAEVRAGVFEKFAVQLSPEPRLIGLELPRLMQMA